MPTIPFNNIVSLVSPREAPNGSIDTARSPVHDLGEAPVSEVQSVIPKGFLSASCEAYVKFSGLAE